MEKITISLFEWLESYYVAERAAKVLATTTVGIGILATAFILLIVSTTIIKKVAHAIATRTTTEWDDIFLKNKTFTAIAHLVPASIVYFTSGFANTYYPQLQPYFEKAGEIYLLLATLAIINAVLTSMNEIYNKSFAFSKQRPVAGFIQLLKIFIYFAGFLALIAILFDKKLINLFTGLGAAAAILMLVFKDSILGFVASIQISMNDMIKLGDWIAMPSRGADGDVIEINLTTVKVQNWDKTISMIPTYSLITESFVNWRGMELSGGRRIKRSINIDMHSVEFCTEELLEKLKRFMLISEYVIEKQAEIESYNQQLNLQPGQIINGRRQTNLGIFRKYLELYLKHHPMVNQEMTLLVRHLQPTEKGLPIEIYLFSKEKQWVAYEAIQADIFDHILAIIPEFGLRVFQYPCDQNSRNIQTLID